MAAVSLVMVSAFTTAAEASSTRSQRADVRHMLAPVNDLENALARDAPAQTARGTAWAAVVRPCVQAAYTQLSQDVQAGTLTSEDQTIAGSFVFAVALLDAAVELSAPFDHDLAQAQRAYQHMNLRDPVLRAGARAKAREIAAVRRLADIDACQFTQAWAAAGFSILAAPEVAPGLTILDVGSMVFVPPVPVQRAARRLHRLGVAHSRATVFQTLPVLLFALPTVGPEFLPPTQ